MRHTHTHTHTHISDILCSDDCFVQYALPRDSSPVIFSPSLPFLSLPMRCKGFTVCQCNPIQLSLIQLNLSHISLFQLSSTYCVKQCRISIRSIFILVISTAVQQNHKFYSGNENIRHKRWPLSCMFFLSLLTLSQSFWTLYWQLRCFSSSLPSRPSFCQMGLYWGILSFLKASWHLALASLSLSFCTAHAPPVFSWHFLIWPSLSVCFYVLSNSLFLWLPSCQLSCLSFLLLSPFLPFSDFVNEMRSVGIRKCVRTHVYVCLRVRMCWKTNYLL